MSRFRRLEIVDVLSMKKGQEKSNPGHFGGGETRSELFPGEVSRFHLRFFLKN
jgi:hypothetical protein